MLSFKNYVPYTYIPAASYVDEKQKFVLIFHPQQNKLQPGTLVNIFVLANGRFLSADEVIQQNRLAANSPIAPSNKFLILAEGVE
jgi:hypothetical protein